MEYTNLFNYRISNSVAAQTQANSKWKLMLLYYISQDLSRPSQLQKKLINADRRVLDKQLNELVLHGFLEKHTFNTKVQKVEYELTSLGKELLPLILTSARCIGILSKNVCICIHESQLYDIYSIPAIIAQL